MILLNQRVETLEPPDKKLVQWVEEPTCDCHHCGLVTVAVG